MSDLKCEVFYHRLWAFSKDNHIMHTKPEIDSNQSQTQNEQIIKTVRKLGLESFMNLALFVGAGYCARAEEKFSSGNYKSCLQLHPDTADYTSNGIIQKRAGSLQRQILILYGFPGLTDLQPAACKQPVNVLWSCVHNEIDVLTICFFMMQKYNF